MSPWNIYGRTVFFLKIKVAISNRRISQMDFRWHCQMLPIQMGYSDPAHSNRRHSRPFRSTTQHQTPQSTPTRFRISLLWNTLTYTHTHIHPNKKKKCSLSHYDQQHCCPKSFPIFVKRRSLKFTVDFAHRRAIRICCRPVIDVDRN